MGNCCSSTPSSRWEFRHSQRRRANAARRRSTGTEERIDENQETSTAPREEPQVTPSNDTGSTPSSDSSPSRSIELQVLPLPNRSRGNVEKLTPLALPSAGLSHTSGELLNNSNSETNSQGEPALFPLLVSPQDPQDSRGRRMSETSDVKSYDLSLRSKSGTTSDAAGVHVEAIERFKGVSCILIGLSVHSLFLRRQNHADDAGMMNNTRGGIKHPVYGVRIRSLREREAVRRAEMKQGIEKAKPSGDGSLWIHTARGNEPLPIKVLLRDRARANAMTDGDLLETRRRRYYRDATGELELLEEYLFPGLESRSIQELGAALDIVERCQDLALKHHRDFELSLLMTLDSFVRDVAHFIGLIEREETGKMNSLLSSGYINFRRKFRKAKLATPPTPIGLSRVPPVNGANSCGSPNLPTTPTGSQQGEPNILHPLAAPSESNNTLDPGIFPILGSSEGDSSTGPTGGSSEGEKQIAVYGSTVLSCGSSGSRRVPSSLEFEEDLSFWGGDLSASLGKTSATARASASSSSRKSSYSATDESSGGIENVFEVAEFTVEFLTDEISYIFCAVRHFHRVMLEQYEQEAKFTVVPGETNTRGS